MLLIRDPPLTRSSSTLIGSPNRSKNGGVTYNGLVSGEVWVMDGAFVMEGAIARADTVVVVDLPRWRGLLGAIRRNLH